MAQAPLHVLPPFSTTPPLCREWIPCPGKQFGSGSLPCALHDGCCLLARSGSHVASQFHSYM